MAKVHDDASRPAPRALPTLCRAAACCAAIALPLALTSCNTIEGTGEDLEAAGEEIEDTAEDAN